MAEQGYINFAALWKCSVGKMFCGNIVDWIGFLCRLAAVAPPNRVPSGPRTTQKEILSGTFMVKFKAKYE